MREATDTYALTLEDVRAILADPEFYESCPEFAFLSLKGATIATETSTSSVNLPGAFRELVEAFVACLRLFREWNPLAIARVRHYLEACYEQAMPTVVIADEIGEPLCVF